MRLIIFYLREWLCGGNQQGLISRNYISNVWSCIRLHIPHKARNELMFYFCITVQEFTSTYLIKTKTFKEHGVCVAKRIDILQFMHNGINMIAWPIDTQLGKHFKDMASTHKKTNEKMLNKRKIQGFRDDDLSTRLWSKDINSLNH